MAEHRPSTVQVVFDRYETSREPFHEHELAATIQNAAGPADALKTEQRRAVWLEISAFYFIPTSKSGASIWGTYFAPMMTGIPVGSCRPVGSAKSSMTNYSGS